jgi:hypothetical protein
MSLYENKPILAYIDGVVRLFFRALTIFYNLIFKDYAAN